MDTKLLSKVPTWNGDEDQWFGWSFAFRAYCVVSSLISSEDLERAAGSTTSLPLAGQSPEARVRSGALYYLLVLLCSGNAQVILRSVEVGNGVEGWRVLSARYDRRDTTSTTGLLQAILGFEMSDDLERIPDKLAEFELMIQRYTHDVRRDIEWPSRESHDSPDVARTSQVALVGQCSTIHQWSRSTNSCQRLFDGSTRVATTDSHDA